MDGRYITNTWAALGTGYQARIEELEGQAENLAVRASEAQAEAESVRQEAKNREAELASAYEEGVENNG